MAGEAEFGIPVRRRGNQSKVLRALTEKVKILEARLDAVEGNKKVGRPKKEQG